MKIDQLAPDKQLSPELVGSRQAWTDEYPWLHRAFSEIGPAARAASDGWRARIQDDLKTTLAFKVRPDGTAAVWCGMSVYDFRHDPTPKELLEGLAEAYRRELEYLDGGYSTRTATWKMSVHVSSPVSIATGSGPVETRNTCDPLFRLGAELLPRVLQLVLIFAAVTAVTLVLSAVANTVR